MLGRINFFLLKGVCFLGTSYWCVTCNPWYKGNVACNFASGLRSQIICFVGDIYNQGFRVSHESLILSYCQGISHISLLTGSVLICSMGLVKKFTKNMILNFCFSLSFLTWYLSKDSLISRRWNFFERLCRPDYHLLFWDMRLCTPFSQGGMQLDQRE